MKKFVVFLCTAVMTLALSGAAFAGTITQTDALKTALHDAGLAKSAVKAIEVEKDKGTFEVEFIQKATKTKFSYDISAKSGKILEKGAEYAYKHNSSKAKIGKKAALKKVAKAAGVKLSIVKKGTCTYRYKKHEGTYEVKFRYKGWKYDYELLAPTGKVIEWEMDRIGK